MLEVVALQSPSTRKRSSHLVETFMASHKQAASIRFDDMSCMAYTHDQQALLRPRNEDGRLRFRPDIVLEGPAYAGIKRSRKAAFQDAGEDYFGEEVPKDAILFGNEETFFNSEERSENVNETLQQEMQSLEKEYKDLQKQEEEMLKNLKAHEDTELKKSVAVSHQKDLWDKALEIRIALQKHFSNSNRIPTEDIRLALCKDDDVLSTTFANLIRSAVQTLDCLTNLLKALIDQNNAITGVEETARTTNVNPRQRTEDGLAMGSNAVIDQADAAWREVNCLYSRVAPYRDDSVNKWHRKTQLSTGAAVMKSKLRAFNQSISHQIANLMRDPSRLIARMHLKRYSLHVLGLPAEARQANSQVHQSLSEECDTNQVVDDVDPELFDDSEFYQQLLHEFLESSDLAALGGATMKLRNKKRKVVDRRASKGRKIRYNVHEKIVNFMVPEPISIPQMADKLFANLFGQKSLDTERT